MDNLALARISGFDMDSFSRFAGDDNEELFALQKSVWWGHGYASALVQFLGPSISKYRECANSIGLIDPITMLLNTEYFLDTWLFIPFLEIISAYYRFVYGCQPPLPIFESELPKSNEEWIAHYKYFMHQEGEDFLTDYDFFPNIIHLIVIHNLPYAIELQKFLLLIVSRSYTNRIKEKYDKEISFLSQTELRALEQHENQFELLYRDEIINLIKKEKLDKS